MQFNVNSSACWRSCFTARSVLLRTGPEREILSGGTKTDIGPLRQDQRKKKALQKIRKLGEDSKNRSLLVFNLHTDLLVIDC